MAASGAVILGCESPRLGAAERAFFARAQPWGFILFARNCQDPAQLRRLTGALRDAVGRDAPVLIDQEGGRVQRLGPPHWRAWLPPLDHVAAADIYFERAMWLRYRIIAHELRAVGIDADCAPMADIAEDATHPFLKNRCYGFDPSTVARAARAVAEGLLAGGVLPVVKHIPGHGRAFLDSHKALPVVDQAPEVLAAHDFSPFRALANLPLGMTGHLLYPRIDSDTPATLSPRLVGLIRENIGFGGLLMTDDISMQALSGSLAQRSRAALDAGCDLVLHCTGRLPEMEEVAAAAGPMTAAAVARGDAALASRRPPQDIDIAAAEAELAALVARA